MKPDINLIWAKTDMQDPSPERWLPLTRHLEDTKETARLIWDRWLSDHVKHILATDIGTPDTAKNTYLFLAATHDIGKASPAFAVYVANNPTYGYLLQRMQDAGFDIHPNVIAMPEKRRHYRHELVGYAALRLWLENHGCDKTVANSYAAVIGGHHGSGISTDGEDLVYEDGDIASRFSGKTSFIAARDRIIDVQFNDTGMRLPRKPLSRRCQVLLMGLVIMADWIASDQTGFPLVGMTPADSRERAGKAWRRLALPAPWAPEETPDCEELFKKRFKFKPRPFQTSAMHTAKNMRSPGIMVLEAPMGEGKTEAALAAAEILCAKFGLGGVYFALPTRATADAMFSRFSDWMSHLPANGKPAAASVFLAHGKNKFNERFSELPAWAPSNVDNGTLQATSNMWLRGRKRGNLANFVVGTIDQTLAVALKTKHLVLRHLAMAGKVVILDEVHACDTYMSEYLNRALEWLGLYEIPVVLMSATLTPEKRSALIEAYEHGRTGRKIERHASPKVATPLISSASGTHHPEGSCRQSTMKVRILPDRDFTKTVKEAYAAGAKIAVIRDTVRRAMETYDTLRAEGLHPVLDHSRFTSGDRAAHDAQVLSTLAPGAREPAVVVATQVMEQSLDVDADLMISDIAPMDLLFQRSGRLHRHTSPRPSGYEQPLLLLSGVELKDHAPVFAMGISSVYMPWTLIRTLDVLGLRGETDEAVLRMPENIPEMVNEAYDESLPSFWGADGRALGLWRTRGMAEQAKARSVNMIVDPRYWIPEQPLMEDWFTVGGHSDTDDDAFGVRDGGESIDLVLLESRGGRLCPVGGSVPLPSDWTDLGREDLIGVEASTISVSSFMTGGESLSSFCDKVDAAAPELWRRIVESGPLTGESALVLDRRSSDGFFAVLKGVQVCYSSVRGWSVAHAG